MSTRSQANHHLPVPPSPPLIISATPPALVFHSNSKFPFICSLPPPPLFNQPGVGERSLRVTEAGRERQLASS